MGVMAPMAVVTKPHTIIGILCVALKTADGRECILTLDTSGYLNLRGIMPIIIAYVRLWA
jgi:hypothetical protein